MRILKFKKNVDIEKNIRNLKLQTFHYGSFDKNGKSKHWTELCLWYDNDCENCPCGWEDRSYEGECYDCGCYISKDGDFSAPTLVCMLPNWVKRILLKLKMENKGVTL